MVKKQTMRKVILLIVALLIVGSLGSLFAVGSLPKESDVTVRLGTDTAAIFLNLRNDGLLPDCIVDVRARGESMGREFELKAELHKTEIDGNIIKMMKVDKVCVGPLSEVRMRGVEGEGYHIMVFGDVEKVEMFHIDLKFESGKVLHFHVKSPSTPTTHEHEHKH